MQENLVIVESPAKAKTIEKFLGKEYKVMSSFGHVRDLKKQGMGIEIENNYLPEYEIPKDKEKLVKELRDATSKAKVIWLASDEDREGEAIAWHLYEVLDLKNKITHRIVFHEITESAIKHAIENPRSINLDIVDAQQARRVLDRLVGFEISPILWKKVMPKLSAGRVQSVALRLVVEREREITSFNPEASYRVFANFLHEGAKFSAELNKKFSTYEEAKAFLEGCIGANFRVNSIQKHPTHRAPAAPFTTSTLQQEAARKFNFSVATTMMVAQSLYESGKITYMRTDSVNLSDLALASAKKEIISMAGENYYKRRQYTTKSKGAQEAHEAIRPTYMSNHTITGTPQEVKLYELIWKRTIASQMADAQFEKTDINIDIIPTETMSDAKSSAHLATIAPSDSDATGKNFVFVASGEVNTFDGFLKVYKEGTDDIKEESQGLLPAIAEGQMLNTKDITAIEKFSQRPYRYTEASLVRKLEELGIGRPSTYAPTISTIINRNYVEKREVENVHMPYHTITLVGNNISDKINTDKPTVDKGKLLPTDIGTVVTDYLIANFPEIMDYNFTALVEEKFDAIAEGESKWTVDIDHFYKQFHPMVEKADNSTGRKVGERELGIDPVSGKPVYAKIGRFGPMIQLGEQSDEGEKPRFASLRKNQSIETITLDEALELFKLPITLGVFEEKNVSVNIGKFGPYVRLGNEFFSIPKGEDPLDVSYERAVEIIENKRQADREKILASYPDNDIEVINGRFGPYISHAGNNYKLPRNIEKEALTLEFCLEKIKETPTSAAKGKVSRKSTATKAKSTAKSTAKTSAKSATAKTTSAKTAAKTASAKTGKTTTKKTTAKTTKKSTSTK